MAAFSLWCILLLLCWPLALVVAGVYTPVLPWFRWLQRRQLAAYDALRTRVGDMLGRSRAGIS